MGCTAPDGSHMGGAVGTFPAEHFRCRTVAESLFDPLSPLRRKDLFQRGMFIQIAQNHDPFRIQTAGDHAAVGKNSDLFIQTVAEHFSRLFPAGVLYLYRPFKEIIAMQIESAFQIQGTVVFPEEGSRGSVLKRKFQGMKDLLQKKQIFCREGKIFFCNIPHPQIEIKIFSLLQRFQGELQDPVQEGQFRFFQCL